MMPPADLARFLKEVVQRIRQSASGGYWDVGPIDGMRLLSALDAAVELLREAHDAILNHGVHKLPACTYNGIVEAPSLGYPKKPCVCGLDTYLATLRLVLEHKPKEEVTR